VGNDVHWGESGFVAAGLQACLRSR